MLTRGAESYVRQKKEREKESGREVNKEGGRFESIEGGNCKKIKKLALCISCLSASAARYLEEVFEGCVTVQNVRDLRKSDRGTIIPSYSAFTIHCHRRQRLSDETDAGPLLGLEPVQLVFIRLKEHVANVVSLLHRLVKPGDQAEEGAPLRQHWSALSRRHPNYLAA
ncbi:hypothetical protein DPEC_G00056900 [Dallia pectoralis]|uniref:Uncharacterized protein n=1 Tax=Dallia pectoralis TaxID=75939 RepID=A0ACC2H708_DALPE|nr:hypothetical protein DPEC_G00056900 [Dallia pectoralis]